MKKFWLFVGKYSWCMFLGMIAPGELWDWEWWAIVFVMMFFVELSFQLRYNNEIN